MMVLTMSRDEKYDEVVLDFAKQRIQDETDRAQTLRDRASALIQIDLVLLGVLVTVLTAIGARATYSSIQIFLFSLGIVLPLASTMICIWVLTPMKKRVFDIARFDELHGQDRDRMDALLGTLLSTADEGVKETDIRTRGLLWAYGLLATGIITIGFVSLSLALW